MNELWIDLGMGFLYFATNKTNLPDALEEFLDKLDTIGCISDNFGWEEIELRNEDGDAIEYLGCGAPRDLGRF